jgi:hypothetical protein
MEPYPQVPAYLKEMSQRPATQKVAEDRKANAKLMAEKAAAR